jgi:4-alpha-glucanotransferase
MPRLAVACEARHRLTFRGCVLWGDVGALHAYLTRTPAVLVGVSLADAAGKRRPQHMPGTVDEYPNWRSR